ncbi:MAG: S16 family serine protease [Verrucomicrobiota bacterium]
MFSFTIRVHETQIDFRDYSYLLVSDGVGREYRIEIEKAGHSSWGEPGEETFRVTRGFVPGEGEELIKVLESGIESEQLTIEAVSEDLGTHKLEITAKEVAAISEVFAVYKKVFPLVKAGVIKKDLLENQNFDEGKLTSSTMTPGVGAEDSSDKPSIVEEVGIRKNQAQVNGLLVMELGGENTAGSASPMTLSAIKADPTKRSSFDFNQEVGSSMSRALKEVSRFIEVRHGAWPMGYDIEISFENKYDPKDGPSAAVACALLLESAITGKKLDSSFAVTGDLNTDGSVQPVGGIDAKIRGASAEDCTHVAIPDKNVFAVYDSIINDGFSSVLKIQVFSIEDFDEALALALVDRERSLQKSMEQFRQVIALYEQSPQEFSSKVKHPKVVSQLKEILETVPNHLSAKVLEEYASGKFPKRLSLHGSVEFIENRAFSIFDVIEDGKVARLDELSENQVTEAVILLRSSQNKLDERTWEWARMLIDYGNLLNRLQTSPPNSTNNFNKMVAEINSANDEVRLERERLFSKPEVMEELLQ